MEVSSELSHVELKVAHLGQFVHLLDEQHGIVLACRHQEVIIGQSHQAIKLDSRIRGCSIGVAVDYHLLIGRCNLLFWVFGINCRFCIVWHLLLSQEF